MKLAKLYYPDRVANRDKNKVREYTNRFQQIQEAYEILKYKMAL